MARITPLSSFRAGAASSGMDEATQLANAASHRIGVVDDCYRCIYCEIGSWNAWKEPCPA